MDIRNSHRQISAEELIQCIENGIYHEGTFRNRPVAREFFQKAQSMIEEAYGIDSKLCDYMAQYDYMDELGKGNYRKAILRLAKAGNLLHQFSAADIMDEFTEWIYKNKEERLNEVAIKTWEVYSYFNIPLSIEKGIAQAVLTSGDTNDFLNEIFIEPLGLPYCFGYLVESDEKRAKNTIPLKEAIPLLKELMDILEDGKTSSKTNQEKTEIVFRLRNIMKKMKELSYHGGVIKGLYEFSIAKMSNIDYTIIRGMSGIEEYEIADNIMEELSEVLKEIDDVETKIRLMAVKAIIAKKEGNDETAEKIWGLILEEEEKLALQLFVPKSEQEKLEYSRDIGELRKILVHVALFVSGVNEAYEFVLHRRTLTIDYINNKASGYEGRQVVWEMLHLEEEKGQGKDIGIEQEKYNKWFEKATDGAFSCKAEQVIGKLKDNQALLEITVAEHETKGEYYLAFVVLSNGIIPVTLGEKDEIDRCFRKIYDYMVEYSANRYSKKRIQELEEYRQIFIEVLMLLGDVIPSKVRELMVVPEGEIAKLPFELLPCFQWYDRYMCEDYKITYLNTGRELIPERSQKLADGYTVIGAPSFSPNSNFPELPASKYEVDYVGRILGISPLTGKEARVKYLEKPARLIHISTHSFRLEKEEGVLVNPMEQSILVFADGDQISAKEIAELNLKGTELTVLSVCNDGKDDIIYNEGGIGIRRAFIQAGVRYLVMSLWKADDVGGSLFMVCFYHYYVEEKKSILYALNQARLYLRESTVEMIRKGPYASEVIKEALSECNNEDKPYSHPYYWAGYILIGC